MADKLLLSLLRAGQKACNIARLCRSEQDIFATLIQEKGRLKNQKLDFKTLADVFIQEVVKAGVGLEFPELYDRVYGEENNQFTNTHGETITVELKGCESETADLLVRVLNGYEKAARLLAAAAHAPITSVDVEESKLMKLAKCDLDINRVGIWIDPIDGTSQYVKGKEDICPSQCGVYAEGLQCVTVLIGVFDTLSGLPVMGVVCQPFHAKIEGNWTSTFEWGICHNNLKLNNIEQVQKTRSSEDPTLVIASNSDELTCRVIGDDPSLSSCVGSGAGYKCLCAVRGNVDAYVYSEDACYKWDTCAVHAILLSLGGGIVCLRDVVQGGQSLSEAQVLYNKPNPAPQPTWANLGGMIAYKSPCIEALVENLKKCRFF